jgi:hypothetical protein
MSLRETPMVRWYWEQVGGTLIEEFLAVRRTKANGPRLLDAVILPKGEKRIAHWRDVSIEGEDVIVVQAKASRLGMYLMGQAVFSVDLIKRFGPASVRSIALCRAGDAVLEPFLKRYPEVEVVVVPKQVASSGHTG